METNLPLSAVLSQAYVAFAIEFDNEFEHQAPHRTANYGSTPGFPKAPWLVSMAMWRHIPIEGISAADLQSRLAISKKCLNTWLTRSMSVKRPEANPHKANKTASLLAAISSG